MVGRGHSPFKLFPGTLSLREQSFIFGEVSWSIWTSPSPRVLRKMFFSTSPRTPSLTRSHMEFPHVPPHDIPWRHEAMGLFHDFCCMISIWTGDDGCMSKRPNMNNWKHGQNTLGYSTWLWVHLPGGAPRPWTWTDLRVPVHPTILQVFQADTARWCQKVPKIEEGRSRLLTISYQCQYTFSNILHTDTCFQYTRRIQHSHTNVIYLQYLLAGSFQKFGGKRLDLTGRFELHGWRIQHLHTAHQQNLTLHHAFQAGINSTSQIHRRRALFF